MTKVFISYSRKDKVFAGKLTEALEKSELETWIDWDDIPPTADWMDQIHNGIEQTDAFLFLLSPDSVASKVCGQEVDHAVQNGKRLIPIVVRDVNPNDVHPALAKVNWIYGRESDDFDGAVNKTLSAIRTDLAWVESHCRLQVRALEWERKQKENSFLFRGKDLQDAEQQLSIHATTEPQPTELQREYVLKSRQVADKQRRLVTTLSVVAAVIMLGLAIFGFNRAVEATSQKNTAQNNALTAVANEHVAQTAQANAEQQAKIARSRELAANAVAARPKSFDLSLLLGNEALAIDNNSQTRGALFENALMNPHLAQYLSGHTDSVTSVAFSPDGKIIAAGSDDETVILWDAVTYQKLGAPLTGHSGWITSIAFSPDGRILASGGCTENAHSTEECVAGQILLWDIAHRSRIGDPLVSNTGAITSLAFSPDGTLAAGDYFGGIALWNVVNQQPIRDRLTGHSDEVTGLVFSPDGKTLVSSSFDNTIFFWDTNTYTHEEVLSAFSGITGYNPYNIVLAFSPDGKVLASGSADRTIILWNVETHSAIGNPLLGHTNNVISLAFNSAGSILASGDIDGKIILWDVSIPDSPYNFNTLSGQGDSINSLAFGLKDILVSGSTNGTVILWDPSTLTERFGHPIPGGNIVAFSPDGNLLVTGICAKNNDFGLCAQSTLLFLDIAHGDSTGTALEANAGEITSLAFSPDGYMLASGGSDSTIFLWNTVSRQPIGNPLIGHTSSVTGLIFSADGKKLFSAGGNEMIEWDLQSSQRQSIPMKVDDVNIVSAFSLDRKHLATASVNAVNAISTITLWDLTTNQPTDTTLIKSNGLIKALAFSPDGKYLASGGDNEIITIWDVATHQPLGLSINAETMVYCLVFSPDSKTLAVGTYSGITLWDLASRQPLSQQLNTESEYVTSIAFHPENKSLVTGGSQVLLWSLDPYFWTERTCQRAGRNFTHAEWALYFPDENYRPTCAHWPPEPEITATPIP
jgi:WD40 repeat protein